MERLGAEKIIYNADRLLQIKEKGDTFPVHIQIGLTEYCCHKCIFCHTEFATADTTKNATMDREVLIQFLKEAAQCGTKAVTLVGSGEPLLHPQIVEILYDIKNIGLNIGIFTNGSRVNDVLRKAILDTCTFVRFSVNASNREEHEKVHQVKDDFDNIVNNIRMLVEERKMRKQKLPTLGTQLVFYEDNYRTMVDAAKLWKKVGVDYFEIKPVIAGEGNSVNVKIFPAKDTQHVLQLMNQAKELEDETFQVYTKYGQYQASITDEKRCYGRCYAQSIQSNLWADGNLFLCANHESEEDVLGNIYHESFREIWLGERRKSILKNLRVSQCPKGCIGHALNEFIWDYMYPDEEIHPNFV